MNKYSKLFNPNMAPKEASFILFSMEKKIPKEDVEERELLFSAYKNAVPEIVRNSLIRNKGYCTE